MGAAERAIIEQLQKQIHAWEGCRRQVDNRERLGLGALEDAFPEGVFPRGVVHELLSGSGPEASSTSGFIAMLLGKLMGQQKCSIWIGSKNMIYPPALASFGVAPERIIFVETRLHREALWAVEEALKCPAVVAVVGELSELEFNASRRLQLAVEQSGVTGFMHRHSTQTPNAVSCVSRWRVSPVASRGRLPGPGAPAWQVDLLKVRNGRPGSWQVEWTARGLEYIERDGIRTLPVSRKTA